MSTTWRGYFAAVPTPFDRDGALDPGRLRDVLAWFLCQRAHGIVVNGTTGEWVAQSLDERARVLEISRAVVPTRTPLIVGISSIRPDDSVVLGQHAAEMGADGALLTIPPGRWLSDDEIADFYTAMAERIRLPLLVYNVPVVVGYDLPPELLGRLLTIDGIVGVKDNTPSSERRLKTLREFGAHHAIFSDVLEPSTFPVFAEGAVGRGQIGSGMPLGNRLADAFEAVWRGDVATAQRIVDDLTDFKRGVQRILGAGQPWHAQIKAVMFASGVDAGYPRFPSRSIREDAHAMVELAALLEEFAR